MDEVGVDERCRRLMYFDKTLSNPTKNRIKMQVMPTGQKSIWTQPETTFICMMYRLLHIQSFLEAMGEHRQAMQCVAVWAYDSSSFNV